MAGGNAYTWQAMMCKHRHTDVADGVTQLYTYSFREGVNVMVCVRMRT